MADQVTITTQAGSGAVVNSSVSASGSVSSAVSPGSSAQSQVAALNSFQTQTTGASGPQGEPGENGVFSEIASQAEAEAGVNNTKGMSSLRTKQAIDALQAVESVNGANGVVVLDADDISDTSTTHKFTTTGDITKLAGISSGATANSSDAVLLSRANHTGTQAISTVVNLQSSLDGKVDANASITGATKTKVTYDAKGLVTAGADATTADIADSANKRYVTDAQLTVIGNTSGTNTGDQNISELVTGPASATANVIPRYNGTTGKIIKSTGYTIDDDNTLLTDGLVNSTTIVAAPLVAADDIEEYNTDAGVTVETVLVKDGLVDGRDVSVDGTKLDGVEALADVTDAANVDAAGATMNTDTTLAGNGYFLDEDAMTSDSATKVPSQQSVKAYVDAQVAGGGGVVDTIVAGNNIDVDATDPANPIVTVETLTLADISDVTASVTELNYIDGVTSAIQTQLGNKQPLDSDLTTIAGLTATTDNFLQSKSSAWASRTPAQAAVDLLPYVYPIGCIYFSTNSTNPGTSLGFGTWSAFGAGRVPVGFDSGQTEFDTDEETGGAKTVTLTSAQSGVPAHTHPNKFGNTSPGDGSGMRYSGTDGTSASGTFTLANTAADASQAHNNLQPYIVVRMWKRTA